MTFPRALGLLLLASAIFLPACMSLFR
jgi:hypothetical protein